MKKYYQPRGGKKGRFALRENTYRRMRYLIADYPYFKYASSKRIAEPMFEYDVGKDQCERYIKAIEEAMEQVPPEYVEHVMSHIIERKKYEDMEVGASERTMKHWVQRFIWNVAHNLGDA